MARARRSGTAKVAIAALAVAALTAAVYFTKPGGSARKGEAASSKARPAAATPTVEPPGRGAAAGVSTQKAAAGPVAKEHGPDAVVRSSEDLGALSAAQLPLATPVWNAPTELTFSSLKALRRGYRERKSFSPEDVARLHGGAVVIRGALMPIDPIPKSGEMARFWLANPVVVMAGCVFCFPPTLADLVYVTTDGPPFVVDRERLYRSVEFAKLLGRFELGPGKSEDGVEYMFSMRMKELLE